MATAVDPQFECTEATSPSYQPLRGTTAPWGQDVILPSLPKTRERRAPLFSQEERFLAVDKNLQKAIEQVTPLVRINRDTPRPRKIEILQQWEGEVTNLGNESAWLLMSDLRNAANPDDSFEIPLKEFAPSDHRIMAIGTIVYWTIAYETAAGGQVRRISELRVQRTPEWSQRDLDEIDREAEKLLGELNGSGAAESPATN
jgi:hypothetical protein